MTQQLHVSTGPDQQLMALFDRVAGKMLPPFLSDNISTAQRALAANLRNDQNLTQNHGDYDLYHLGAFFPQGRIIALPDGPAFICTVSSLKVTQ